MNLVFTCGGTGGHINPALAVAKMFRERYPDCRILFIGAEGMEQDLIPREGFRLEPLRVSGFQRKLTPKALWSNAVTAWDLAGALRKARRILKEFDAHAVIGTGGYASFPALREAARLGIPTVVHESNAAAGLATRMVSRQVDRILVAFEACRKNYPHPEKVVVTGTPCREEFLYGSRAEARKSLGLDDTPLVVSCWGSLGAREMNRKIADFMVCAAKENRIRHIHATGSYGWRWMPQLVREKGLDLAVLPNLDLREYIYNMPTVMAAADLMICRAGAATISELTVSGTPAILVPSPNVADDHQSKNAAVLEQAGAAVVIREADSTGELLYKTAAELLADPQKLREMRQHLAELAVVDSTERICAVILELVNARR